MSIIQIQHLYKTFGTGENAVHALEDISLDIQKGEIFGIIGLSGAGKSTLVRCMNLLERPTSGTVIVDGKDMTALSEKELRLARRNVTMIFQSFNLLMQRTVLKNVCFPMELSGTPAAQARKRALELLDLVGLREKADAYPSQLSGGQKQRVAIAGVIAMEPKVLILDEPTAGLDPRGREAILAQIRAYHQKRGTTVILVSHSMEEIACNVDRILVLRGSHVYMDGTPRQVFRRADDLEDVGLDVPQATKIALALRRMGLEIDTAVYTVDELEQALLSVRGEAGVC